MTLPNPSQGVDEALSCRREFPERNYKRCGKPAEFIVWGKLFPADALGPRCYDCAATQAGRHGLVPGNPQGYAIYHLPNFPALRKQIREELEGELLSDEALQAHARRPFELAGSDPTFWFEIDAEERKHLLDESKAMLQATLSSLKERER